MDPRKLSLEDWIQQFHGLEHHHDSSDADRPILKDRKAMEEAFKRSKAGRGVSIKELRDMIHGKKRVEYT